MPMDRDSSNDRPAGGAVFATTHWSVVLAAGQDDSPAASQALETLCRTYWYPLYAYIRRGGHAPHDAEDLTQEFFARLLAKDFPAGISPLGGKFRSYLLTALKHFLANEREYAQTAKRGGGKIAFSLDELDAETRYQFEPADEETPESLFEKRWASTLLDQAMHRLQAEYLAAGKADLFDRLKPFLTGADRSIAYAGLAAQLQTSEDAVKMAVHRLRKRYGEVLRAEIAQTVARPQEIEEEIRQLIRLAAK